MYEPTQTVGIETISADIEENDVRLRLNIIDTPGFGDFVNNENAWDPILQTIEARFEAYLEQENRVNRAKIQDSRVHALLYFIQPTGHALRPIDLEFLSRLHKRVNIIPVIAKSDTVSPDELPLFKQRILRDLEFHGIEIVKLPIHEDDDEESIAEMDEIQSKLPFAIVGSNELVKSVDGRAVRGRSYPWGVIEVDNEAHCDFVKLRQMLIRSNMEDLRELTNRVYEGYRTHKLLSLFSIASARAARSLGVMRRAPAPCTGAPGSNDGACGACGAGADVPLSSMASSVGRPSDVSNSRRASVRSCVSAWRGTYPLCDAAVVEHAQVRHAPHDKCAVVLFARNWVAHEREELEAAQAAQRGQLPKVGDGIVG